MKTLTIIQNISSVFEAVSLFLFTYRAKFRLTAICSSLMFNFVLIYASWADDFAAWVTSFVIAALAVISALVCHVTQPEDSDEEENEDTDI